MWRFSFFYHSKLFIIAFFTFFILTSLSDVEYTDHDLEHLGRKLFYDSQLSYSNKISCSHCHEPTLAFTDGYRLSRNEKAVLLHKNSPTLLNLDRRLYFNWNSKLTTSLSQQIRGPLFNDHPDEMGFYKDSILIMQRLSMDSIYKMDLKLLKYKKFDVALIISALSAYINKLSSRNSKFDQYKKLQDSTVFTKKEWEGYKVFTSDEAKCKTCHGGQDFFTPNDGSNFVNEQKELSIRIPTLRNVTITFPYFHDGREETLPRAIKDHITLTSEKDVRYHGIKIDDNQIKSIISFLHTLTDTTYLKNPYFTNPFKAKIRS